MHSEFLHVPYFLKLSLFPGIVDKKKIWVWFYKQTIISYFSLYVCVYLNVIKCFNQLILQVYGFKNRKCQGDLELIQLQIIWANNKI